MSPDVIKAQQAVQRLREEIARFQRLRTANNEVISGMRAGTVPPQQAATLASAYRDPNMETQAVEHLRTLIGLLRGTSEAPIQVDLADPLPVGIENGLGVFPVAAAVAATAVSVAIAAYSGFRYMTTREERLLAETRGPFASMLQSISENTWALAALGAVLFGGLVYVDRRWIKGGKLGGKLGSKLPALPPMGTKRNGRWRPRNLKEAKGALDMIERDDHCAEPDVVARWLDVIEEEYPELKKRVEELRLVAEGA